MYLKSVTVTGFKSFANKTVLDLEPGITAIVGPNGSGKSNLADAVRWAFGEQSRTRLRLGEREDVVFAGTDKRSRGSYTQVTLVFDNSNGTFPLDITEVEISRRLYRSGESDLRLAGKSIRSSDLQTLLAQSGFGAGSYAVIGQGMIDSFLLSSPSERKLLFDEAAGTRGPELGRESARRKLAATAGNLIRLKDIEAELVPRLELLEHTVKAAEIRRRTEAEVAQLRTQVSEARVVHWGAARDLLSVRRAELTALLQDGRRDVTRLERELSASQKAAVDAARERDRIQASLAGIELDRDRLALELAEHRSALASGEQAVSQLQDLIRKRDQARAEHIAASDRLQELTAEQSANSEAAARALQMVNQAATSVAAAQSALVAIRRRGSTDGTRDQYVAHALEILKLLANHLSTDQFELTDARLLVHKAGRLLSHASRTGAAELLAELKTAQKNLESAMVKRETAVEHQTNITITGRSLEIDLSHQTDAVSRAQAALKFLDAQLAPIKIQASGVAKLKADVTAVEAQLHKASQTVDRSRLELSRLAAAPEGAQSQLESTASLERTRGAVVAAESELVSVAAELESASVQLSAAQKETGGITPVQPSDRSLSELEADLVRAEARLEARVGADREQAAEYERVKSRHTDLAAQIADLTAAQADLERVIAELEAVIRERFKTNFQSLANQFSLYFSRLFPGGAAGLELTEAEDGTYGIAVKASPAGKRLGSIAALSGGERALAGVALLAAILRVNPSPFVVLDEIDAALDEANSGRLADILTELAEHSQLIVITHNRQTMRAARVLFGITLGENHVSHLISMRLEEAAALAAR